MLIISAKNLHEAALESIKRNKQSYIYLPEDNERERRERIRGLYGFKPTQLIGKFTYEEITILLREVG